MKLFKTLKNAAKLFVPGAGDLIENFESKDGGEKRMHWPKAASMIVRYIIIGLIIFFSTKAVLKDGELDKEEIKILKNNIELLQDIE